MRLARAVRTPHTSRIRWLCSAFSSLPKSQRSDGADRRQASPGAPQMTPCSIYPPWQPSAPANTLLWLAHFKPPLIFLRPGFSTSLIHRDGRPRKEKKVILSDDSGALLDPVICVSTFTVKAESNNIVICVRKAGRKTD